MDNSKNRFIPGTNPSWGIKLPDGYSNSLVDENGRNRDDGCNFDEKDDDNEPPAPESSFDSLSKDRELAEYTKNQIIYAGLFINPEDLYDKFPPSLSHKIRDPHVTTAYHPGVEKLFLDSLDSGAAIRAIGYGNDGKNEGLLVEVLADDPAIQKTLIERTAQNSNGELKPTPMHITLSIAEGAEAFSTRNLHFEPLSTPIELTGHYKLFRNDGALLSDKNTIKEMQQSNLSFKEVEDPDRL